MLNIQKKTILVTYGWQGTAAAIRHFRQEKGWTVADLHHEVVNHSAGEIVNVNGFTTNHIENKWSVVKRWLRKRAGGKLPSYSDRAQWIRLLAEFSWRKVMSWGNTSDWGHTFQVRYRDAMTALRQASR